MENLPAVELYKLLQEYFTVATSYRMGFSKELSPGVLEVIQHVKGDLNPEDIVPVPTTLTVVLKDKSNQKIIDSFNQSSAFYMETFDSRGFETFAENHLTTRLTGPVTNTNT